MSSISEQLYTGNINSEYLNKMVNESNIDGNVGEYYGRFSIAAQNPNTNIKQYRYHKYSLSYQPLFDWDAYYKNKDIVYKWPVYQNTRTYEEERRLRPIGKYDDTEVKYDLNTTRKSFYGMYVSGCEQNIKTKIDLKNCTVYAMDPKVFTDVSKSYMGNAKIYIDQYGLPINPALATLYDPFEPFKIMDNLDGVAYYSINQPITAPTLSEEGYREIKYSDQSAEDWGTSGKYYASKHYFKNPGEDGINMDAFKDFGGGLDYLYNGEGAEKNYLYYKVTDREKKTYSYVYANCEEYQKKHTVGWLQGYHPGKERYYHRIPVNCFLAEHDGKIYGDNSTPEFFQYPNTHFAACIERGATALVVANRSGTYDKTNYCSSINTYKVYVLNEKSYTDGQYLYNVHQLFINFSSDTTETRGIVTSPIWVSSTSSNPYMSYPFGITLKQPHEDTDEWYILDRKEDFYFDYIDLDSKITGIVNSNLSFINIFKTSNNKYYNNSYNGPGGLIYIFNATHTAVDTDGIDWREYNVVFGNFKEDRYTYNNEQIYLADYNSSNAFWGEGGVKFWGVDEFICAGDGDDLDDDQWPYYVYPQITIGDFEEQTYAEVNTIGDFIENVYGEGELAYKDNSFNEDGTLYYGEKEIEVSSSSEFLIGRVRFGIGETIEEPTDFVKDDIIFKFIDYADVDDFYADKYIGEAFSYVKPLDDIKEVNDQGSYMGNYYLLADVNIWDGCIYDQYITNIKYKSQTSDGKLGFGKFIGSQLDLTIKAMPYKIFQYLDINKYFIFDCINGGGGYYLITDSKINSDNSVSVSATCSLESLSNESVDSTIDVCRTYPWQYKATSYTFSYEYPAQIPSCPAWAIYWMISGKWGEDAPKEDEFSQSNLYQYFNNKSFSKWYIDLELDPQTATGYITPLKKNATSNNQTIRKWITNLAKANLLYVKPMQDYRDLCYFDFQIPEYKGEVSRDIIISSSLSQKGYKLESIVYQYQDGSGFFSIENNSDTFESIYYKDNPFMPDKEYEPRLSYMRKIDGETSSKKWIYKYFSEDWKKCNNDLGTDSIGDLYSTFYTGTLKIADAPILDGGFLEVGDVIRIPHAKIIDTEGNYVDRICNMIITSIESDFRTTTITCDVDIKTEPYYYYSGLPLVEEESSDDE